MKTKAVQFGLALLSLLLIIEYSPGNIVIEKVGSKIDYKICLENGLLHDLY